MGKTVAILQARTSSSRLPGKVMKPLLGVPMIGRQIERIRRSRRIDRIVLATSVDPSDDALVRYAGSLGVDVVRGSLDDVLARFGAVRDAFPADLYLRLTGDCPLIDPEVIDALVAYHLTKGADYTCLADPPTFPDGLDAEVMSSATLARTVELARKGPEREHVTLYVREHPEAFRLANYASARDLSAERWTVDTAEDFRFVETVYERLYAKKNDFSMNDVLALLDREPSLRSINSAHSRNEGLMKSLKKDEMLQRYQKSMEWLQRAEKSIPLGSQTFSKSRTQYPMGVSPYFIQKGKGSHVWDVDGNEYVDFVNSLAAINLGHGDPDVNAAVLRQLEDGVIFTLPHPMETLVAEKLIEMVPCAEKVRFGKNGSDATAGAVRVARAYTGRDHVITCGYHGWQDWYIGATARNKGVPEAVRRLTHVVPYNDLAALEKVLNENKDGVAAVILEPMNVFWPTDGYLQKVKELTHRHGALLIFDETITGFRYAKGGAQEYFGVTPDLATFGKGIANGYALSAVAGRADVMKEMEEVFFSFTFGGETLSLAAALATMTKIQKQPVIEHIVKQGTRLQTELKGLIAKHGCEDFLSVAGHPAWSFCVIADRAPYTSWQIKTLFLQEMFARGILTLGMHNMSYAHGDAEISKLIGVYDEVIGVLKEGFVNGKWESLLLCKPLEPLFKVR